MKPTTISIGRAPAAFDVFADFLDGHAAIVRRVRLTIENDGMANAQLVISPSEGPPVRWPLDELRAVPDQAGGDALILRRADNAVARVILRNKDAITSLRGRCRNLHRRTKVKGRMRLFGWGLGAVGSVALIIFVLIPILANQLATLLPPEGEKALGDTTFEQIRTGLDRSGIAPVRICSNAKGVAALERMRARLTDDMKLPYPVQVHVLDHEMINAFALPGGHVVFFRGLIDEAKTPDEVAAVFAHELGHVVHRDPARITLRSAGSIGVLGLLFGDFAGGSVVLFLTERLVQASYTKEAEAKADAFAHETLIRQKISPIALATMFERLRAKYGDEDGIVAHFTSHPAMIKRIEAAKDAAKRAPQDYEPVLSDTDWAALKAVCRRAQ